MNVEECVVESVVGSAWIYRSWLNAHDECEGDEEVAKGPLGRMLGEAPKSEDKWGAR